MRPRSSSTITTSEVCRTIERPDLTPVLRGLVEQSARPLRAIETTFAADDTQTQIAPDLDLTSFTPATYFVIGTTATGTGVIATDPLTAADYVKGTTSGTLTIHNAGHQP